MTRQATEIHWTFPLKVAVMRMNTSLKTCAYEPITQVLPSEARPASNKQVCLRNDKPLIITAAAVPIASQSMVAQTNRCEGMLDTAT